MDTIKEHIEARDYIGLVNFCEDLEFQVGTFFYAIGKSGEHRMFYCLA